MDEEELIRGYLRSLHVPDGNITEGVRELLRRENPRLPDDLIDSIADVSLRIVNVFDFALPDTSVLDGCGREPVPADGAAPEICGILLDRSGRYELLDGHRRLRWCQENGVMHALFLVVS